MTKRIVFLLPSRAGGGAEIVALMQIDYLKEYCKYEVDLVLQVDEGSYDFKNRNYISLGTRNTFLSLWRFILLCKKNDYDLIIGHMAGPNIIVGIVSKLCRKKSLLNIHTVWTVERKSFKGFKHSILNLLYIWSLKYSTRVICVSEGVKADISSVIPAERIDVIYNPLRYKCDLGKRTLPVNESLRLKVLLVGRLVELKRPMEFLRNIASRASMFDYIIIGDGHLYDELREYVRNSGMEGYVSFTGFVDPKDYYSTGDILCLVSTREGFGNVLIEAMYYGTLVMSFDITSGPREILKNNKYGIIVPQDDWNGMLTQLIKINENRRLLNHYKDMGKKRSLDFLPEKVLENYHEIIQQILN